MLKYHKSFLHKVILLSSVYLVFYEFHAHAADQVREDSCDERDQFRNESSSASSETQVNPSRSKSTQTPNNAERPKYLSLTVPSSKIKLIEQKENQLKNNYSDVAYPRQSGLHWNLSELSDLQATNVCYALWLGFTFSEIEELDTTDLPPQLYAYCKKFKKFPIGDILYTGRSNFCYNVVYPYTEKQFKSKHHISVLKCICRFTRKPNKIFTSNDSNRQFFAHKLKDNEYLVFSPYSKNPYKHHDLAIIDVQKVDPTTFLHEDKAIIPISTDQTLG